MYICILMEWPTKRGRNDDVEPDREGGADAQVEELTRWEHKVIHLWPEAEDIGADAGR